MPLHPENRPLVVARTGDALTKSALDTARQRFIHQAIDAEIITAEERFSLHDLKRKGITDYKGTRAEKQEGSGHRSATMC